MLPAKSKRECAQAMHLLVEMKDDESLRRAKTNGRGDAAMKLARQDWLGRPQTAQPAQAPRVITIHERVIGFFSGYPRRSATYGSDFIRHQSAQ
ncbi:hypothetical protein BO78DRAFT_105363 [Aspergillus sclerotiicarbonarius CBS 121057]|uniref:Uncharacterized protein n=1 Tax=Aspergillus sclerotiicarbonarius (strain CBS 121057 / IBT 28362) TaxID=1448318 RepID=A0A319EKH2_ASPSB|nr:hypothetical protein BO78DRAFT_105363 [Aspergillus sclerotiicarbonarius CBS 121057]